MYVLNLIIFVTSLKLWLSIYLGSSKNRFLNWYWSTLFMETLGEDFLFWYAYSYSFLNFALKGQSRRFLLYFQLLTKYLWINFAYKLHKRLTGLGLRAVMHSKGIHNKTHFDIFTRHLFYDLVCIVHCKANCVPWFCPIYTVLYKCTNCPS